MPSKRITPITPDVIGCMVTPRENREKPEIQAWPVYVERVGFISLHDDGSTVCNIVRGEPCILIASITSSLYNENTVSFIATFDFSRMGWVRQHELQVL